MYHSPLINQRETNQTHRFIIYLVRVPDGDGFSAPCVGVTIQNAQEQNRAHRTFEIDLADNGSNGFKAFVRWMASLGFSIDHDITLLKVIEAFGSLVERLGMKVSDITQDDYGVPPSEDTFISPLIPPASQGVHRSRSTIPAC